MVLETIRIVITSQGAWYGVGMGVGVGESVVWGENWGFLGYGLLDRPMVQFDS